MSSDGPPAYNLANHYAEDLRWAGLDRERVEQRDRAEQVHRALDQLQAQATHGEVEGRGRCTGP